MCKTCGIHLIGSVALPDAETVFRTLATELGAHLERIPDGETGERGRWIWWQRKMLLDHPAMELDPHAKPLPIRQWDGKLLRETELVRFKPGVDPSTVSFPTGYAEAAIASYEVFTRLRGEGVIPKGVRFQVSLPTPMASAFMYVSPAAIPAYLPAYEKSLFADLARIAAAVPHADLSIQWDVCQEVLVFEDYFPWRPKDYRSETFATLARLGDAVPAGVELGYHLCYGSPADEHLVMPKDLRVCAELAAGLVSRLNRPLDYLHLPVPKDRTDDAYFAPLQTLRLSPETKLYLGLIHYADHAGDMARIATARRHVTNFGVATECGWGRTEPRRVPGLIAAHRQAIEAMPT
jgi:hypothetical protein